MNITKNFEHKTVLLHEAVNNLNIRPNGIYIDGTFGCGGHSRLILSKLGEKGRLLAIDRDPQAIKIAKTIKDPRFSIIHGPFSAISKYVHERKLVGKINGILFDLGISSPQLDNADRGFSFMHDGPLDMRMDPTSGQSAAEWLHTAAKTEIVWTLKNFGEERFAKKIANFIVARKHKKPIISTRELAEIVITALSPIKNRSKHPATRTFQAIRILINNELEEIKLALNNTLDILASNGKLSIISFHSIECRIVKSFLFKASRGIHIPTKMPLTENQRKQLGCYKLRILGKLTPSKEEIISNPRARSSVLHLAERINI